MGIFVLFLIFTEKILSFHCCIGKLRACHIWCFCCWGIFLLDPVFENFFLIMKTYCILSMLFMHLSRWSYMIFICFDLFLSLYYCSVSYLSFCLSRMSLHLKDKSHLIMVCDPLIYSWIQFARVFLRIFACIFIRDIGLFFYSVFTWFWYQDN